MDNEERCIPGGFFREYHVYELNHRGFVNRSFVELRPMSDEDLETLLLERLERKRQNSDCERATLSGIPNFENENRSRQTETLLETLAGKNNGRGQKAEASKSKEANISLEMSPLQEDDVASDTKKSKRKGKNGKILKKLAEKKKFPDGGQNAGPPVTPPRGESESKGLNVI